jgi:hypothetical protein
LVSGRDSFAVRRLTPSGFIESPAPEAYVLSAAIDGWMKKETDEQIRVCAADAYNKYQNCGVKAARALFATGW